MIIFNINNFYNIYKYYYSNIIIIYKVGYFVIIFLKIILLKTTFLGYFSIENIVDHVILVDQLGFT